MTDDEPRLDEAIAWRVRLNAGDADEATWLAFTAWLEAADANRVAFDHVEDFEDGLPKTISMPPGVTALKRAIPSRGVIWIAAGGLLAASLLVAIGLGMRLATPSAEQYATRVGETKTIALADGSTATLNTATNIEAAVSAQTRNVTLHHGEVLFHVARDPAHPFLVTAGDRVVRVVGTVFDVLRDSGVVTVIVEQGHVAVSRPKGGAPTMEIHLTAGQRATGHEGMQQESVEPVNAIQALSWRDGYLIFDDAPLSRVVADLNRYFAVHISVADDAANRRFSGVLRIDDENAVMVRVARFLSVTVERTGTGIVLHAAGKRD